MGCGTACVKYAVFVFNLLFVLLGIAFIVIGSLFLTSLKHLDQDSGILEAYIESPPILVIVIGCVILIISFFGCCGAIKENTCMLLTYGILLLILFLIQVGLGTYAFITIKNGSTEIREGISTEVIKNIKNYYDAGEGSVKEVVDKMQQGMECCGAEGASDWEGRVPDSCCPNSQCAIPPVYFNKGCVGQVFDYVENIITIIAIVVFSVAGVELGAAIIAFCLSSCIRNNERRGTYY